MELPESELLRQILLEYAVGDLAHYEVLPRGYVNTSYAVTISNGTSHRKYLLRRYRPGSPEAGVIFEHSIINHLEKKGFTLTARVLPTSGGATYISHAAVPDGASLYALFDYLDGEDKYSWIRPACTEGELAEAGAALARFHDAVSDLIPAGERAEPPIVDLLPVIAIRIVERLRQGITSDFERELSENQTLVLCAVAGAHHAIDVPEFRQALSLVNHGDYHPGNLKFREGRVVGIFDLDWSRVDARAFDLGVALTYFCTSWDASRMETYFRLDTAAAFLKAYQTALLNLGGIPPLDEVECGFMADMIAAGNIYVMEWTLRDYYGGPVDAHEYLGYLQHHLCLMRWLEDVGNRRRLDQMLADTLLLP